MEKLSVITPVYNTVHIAENLNSILGELKKLKIPFELIAVDDGSTNSCYSHAKKIKDKNLKVIRYEKNQGKGYALRYGFKFTKGDYVLFIDSDLDIPPGQIKSFISRIGDYDILIASKRHPESKLKYPRIRKFLSFGYQIFVRILFGLNVKDTQVGLKLFKRKVLTEVFKKATVNRYAMDLELLALAHKAGYSIKEGPVVIDFKMGSNIHLKSIVRMFVDTLKVFYRINLKRS